MQKDGFFGLIPISANILLCIVFNIMIGKTCFKPEVFMGALFKNTLKLYKVANYI